MNVRNIVIAVIALVAVGAAGAGLYFLSGTDQAPTQYHKVFPSEAIFKAEFTELNRLPDAIQQLKVVEAIDQSKFGDLIREKWPQFNKKLTQSLGQRAGNSLDLKQFYSKLGTMFTGNGVLYYDAEALEVKNADQTDLGLLFEIPASYGRTGSDSAAMKSFMDQYLIEYANKMQDERSPERAQYSGFDLTVVRSNERSGLVIAHGDRTVIMTNGRDPMEQAIDRINGNGTAQRLVSGERAQAPGVHVEWTDKFTSLLKGQIQNQSSNSYNNRMARRAGSSMLQGLNSFKGHFMVKDGQMALETTRDYNTEVFPEPVQIVYETERGPVKTHQFYGPQTVLFMSQRLPFNSEWFQSIKGWAQDQLGQQAGQFMQFLPFQQVEQLFTSIGPEISVGMRLNEDIVQNWSRSKSARKAVVSVIQTSDSEAITGSLSLLGLAPDVQIKDNQIRFGESPNTQSVHFSFHDQYGVFALDRGTMQQAIDRFKNGTGLTSDEKFSRLRGEMPDSVNHLFYWDISEAGELLQNKRLVQTAMGPDEYQQFRDRVRSSNIKFDPVEETASIMEQLPGSMNVSWNDRTDGVKTRSRLLSNDAGILALPGLVAMGPQISGMFEEEVDEQSVGEGQAALSQAIYGDS